MVTRNCPQKHEPLRNRMADPLMSLPAEGEQDLAQVLERGQIREAKETTLQDLIDMNRETVVNTTAKDPAAPATIQKAVMAIPATEAILQTDTKIEVINTKSETIITEVIRITKTMELIPNPPRMRTQKEWNKEGLDLLPQKRMPSYLNLQLPRLILLSTITFLLK